MNSRGESPLVPVASAADSELLSALKAGDWSSPLVIKWMARLRSMLLTRAEWMLRSDDRFGYGAEDLVGETLLLVLRGELLARCVDMRHVHLLIFNAMRNRLIDIARGQRSRKRNFELGADLEADVTASTEVPQDVLLYRAEIVLFLKEEISKFGARDQKILTAYVNERPQSEIAKELGMSRAAVSVAIARLKAKLRKALEKNGLQAATPTGRNGAENSRS